jgi:hypothetical protein
VMAYDVETGPQLEIDWKSRVHTYRVMPD